MSKARREPRFLLRGPAHGSIVGSVMAMLQSGMVPDRQKTFCIRKLRVVLDDRSRLPWRFFGRLTTAALTA
jgi:hypothetical protein